ncbi:hypothetical protein HTZ77_34670 [Nonomuraea sp. SMC257]|uniref:Uncharacterized protein n=1 Tax=Nonomuraea montanisoli TaxID=2741721 RepID=A0A7Y6M645_9ACTN|nr:hypothetical protein [Nonomuraea montanisoli]NUW36513.1 hypothetical protein [Nonomuraea montanisoli]
MLENRLREALDAKAEIYEPDPRAWNKMTEKAARRRRARRFWTVVLPAVAAVVVVGTVALTEGLFRALPAPAARPLGEVVTDGELKLWFDKVTLSDGKISDALCVETPAESRCRPYYLPKEPTAAGRLLDLNKNPVISIGVAGLDVTSLQGVEQSTDRKLAEGRLYTLKGATAKIWVMRHAPNDGLRFDFRGTGDKGYSIAGVLSRCSNLPPEGPAVELGHGVSATFHKGCLTWWIGGKSTNGTDLGADFDAAEEVRREPLVAMGYGERWYGLVRGGTARVEMVHPGGKRLSADAKPDPWGMGIAVFSVPADRPLNEQDHLVIGYDAAGKEIWRSE